MAATAAIELSVPVLLLWRRTRVAGVLLGLGFHGVLALDLLRHFYDFTGAVVLGLVWFVPLSRRDEQRYSGAAVPPIILAFVAAFTTVLIVLRLTDLFTLWLLAMPILGVLVWTVGSVALGVQSAATVRLAATSEGGPGTTPKARAEAKRHPSVEASNLRRVVPAILILPGLLAFANGAAPYVEVKNYGAWNMYSNLRTADGTSNHLVIRRTLPLSDVLQDRVLNPAESEHGSEWPRQAVQGDLLLSGPAANQLVVDDGREVLFTYANAQAALGPLRFRLQRVAPVSVDGPEPCRMATGM
jgi:hypothetical protein